MNLASIPAAILVLHFTKLFLGFLLSSMKSNILDYLKYYSKSGYRFTFIRQRKMPKTNNGEKKRKKNKYKELI